MFSKQPWDCCRSSVWQLPVRFRAPHRRRVKRKPVAIARFVASVAAVAAKTKFACVKLAFATVAPQPMHPRRPLSQNRVAPCSRIP